jgi:hypothetical protein
MTTSKSGLVLVEKMAFLIVEYHLTVIQNYTKNFSIEANDVLSTILSHFVQGEHRKWFLNFPNHSISFLG